jgi:hypothetical protein
MISKNRRTVSRSLLTLSAAVSLVRNEEIRNALLTLKDVDEMSKTGWKNSHDAGKY